MKTLPHLAIALTALAIPLAPLNAQSTRDEVLAAIQPFTGRYEGQLQRTASPPETNSMITGCPNSVAAAPTAIPFGIKVGAMTKWVGDTDGIVTEASLGGTRVAALTTLASQYAGTGLIPQAQGSVLDFVDLSTTNKHPNPEIQGLANERRACVSKIDMKGDNKAVGAAIMECQSRYLAAVQGIPREQVCVATLNGLLYRTGKTAQGSSGIEARVVRTVSCDKTAFGTPRKAVDDTELNSCFYDVYVGSVPKSASVALSSRKQRAQQGFVTQLRKRAQRR